MKKYDVVALGELLIDFTDNGLSTHGNRLFEANPGGAPCNVLAMLEKLGAKTAFIGKVGNDFLGRMLKEKITAAGINADRLFLDDKIPTTLAFVGKRPDGDRDFAFFRKPGADMMLTTEEAVASAEIIRSSRLFHFGTLSLTDEPVRSATKKAVDIARDSGLLISFDPNYREPLWHSRNDARKAMEYGFSVCDILKIADNEIEFYTGETDIASGAEMIQQKFAIPVVFATSGAAGSSVFYKNTAVSADGFINPDTIETTGAGDTFCACAVSYLLQKDVSHLTEAELKECLVIANAAASIITTRRGALAVMPSKEDINSFLIERGIHFKI